MHARANAPFRTVLSWESYMLGWNELSSKNRANSKLTFPLVNAIDTFILRDFVEYGDMVAIEIPSDTVGNKQRVWLENHHFSFYLK